MCYRVIRLTHVYVLSDDMKYKREKYSLYKTCTCMHGIHTGPYQNWGRNDLGGGGTSWGGMVLSIGDETTMVWWAKQPRVKIEAKCLGRKRLGGETTCYPGV